jgi:hypothetical protein
MQQRRGGTRAMPEDVTPQVQPAASGYRRPRVIQLVLVMAILIGPLLSVPVKATEGKEKLGTPLVERDVTGAVLFAQKQLGSRFGGAWITKGPEGKLLNLGVVGPTEDDFDAISTETPKWVNIKIHAVKYSRTQLVEFARRLQDFLPQTSIEVQGFGPRFDLNKVEVFVASTKPGLREEIVSAVPSDAVAFTGTGKWTALAPASQDPGPTGRGLAPFLLFAAISLFIGLLILTNRVPDVPARQRRAT